MSRFTHNAEQKLRKEHALAESTEAARKAKKGKAGIVAQMRRRGYVPFSKAVKVRQTGQKKTTTTTLEGWKRDPEIAVAFGEEIA